MKEAFYEESAVSQREQTERKLYAVFLIAAVIAFSVAGFILTFSFSYVPNLLGHRRQGDIETATMVFYLASYFGTVILIAAAGVIFWFLKNRFNHSYDYAFVEDELRVSKVINGKKRKYLKNFQADQILKIGKYESEGFAQTKAGMQKNRIVFLTPNKSASEGKELYYFLYTESIEKKIYIIEARQALLELLVRAAGRNKWEAR